MKIKSFIVWLSALFSMGFSQEVLEVSSSGVEVKLGLVTPTLAPIVPNRNWNDSAIAILRFDLETPGKFLTEEASGRANPFWNSDGINNYLWIECGLKGDSIRILGELRDLATGEVLSKIKSLGMKGDFRSLVHSVSNQVMAQFFGDPGVANTRLVFVSTRSGYKEVLSMDYDGARQKMLTWHSSITSFPDLSPDGKKLYYSSFKSGHSSVYEQDMSSGKFKRILASDIQAYGPKVSRNGEWLLFTVQEKGNVDLYKMRLKDRKIFRLTGLKSGETSPDWGVGDREIYFTSDRGGKPQLYRMDPFGADMERLTFTGGYNESSALSPDGQFLAFCRMIGGQMKLVIMNLVTMSEQVITPGFGNYESPSWSPDGSLLALSSDRTGTAQVYLIRPDGTGLKRITRKGRNTSPRWEGSK